MCDLEVTPLINGRVSPIFLMGVTKLNHQKTQQKIIRK